MMNTNIVQFLQTRKFWDPFIKLILIVLVWMLPQIGVEIPQEMLVVISVFLLVLSSWIVRGDINFDLATIEQGRQLIETTQKNGVTPIEASH